MSLNLNGHAKIVESVASWALRIIIAVLAWLAVSSLGDLKTLNTTVDVIDRRLVRVEVKAEESNRRLDRIERKVDSQGSER